jgi:anti-sigma28 factor (negative regulator of flagellin synthesis)
VSLKLPPELDDGEYMKVTGRHPAKSHTPNKAVVSAGTSAIGHDARVKQLKRLVASGRYHVNPTHLAAKILIRALGHA